MPADNFKFLGWGELTNMRVLNDAVGMVHGDILRVSGINTFPETFVYTWQLDRQTVGAWSNFNTLSGLSYYDYTAPDLYNANYRLTLTIFDPTHTVANQVLSTRWADLGRSNRIGAMNISGRVTIDESGVAKPVRLYDRSTGVLVDSLTSSSNGNYWFTNIDNVSPYIVIAYDNSNTYNIVGADNINAI